MFTKPLDQEKVDAIAAELKATILDDHAISSKTSDPEANRRSLFDNCAHVRLAQEHSWELFLDADLDSGSIAGAVAIVKADVLRVKLAAGIACPWGTRGTQDCAQFGQGSECDGVRCGVSC